MPELLYTVHLNILTQQSHQHHTHTGTHTHIYAGDLRLVHEASGGGAGEAVTTSFDTYTARRGGGESLLKRQTRLLRDTEQHWDATQGYREIVKIQQPHRETLTHIHSIESVENEDFQPFSLRLVSGECKKGNWVRVCVSMSTQCLFDMAIYSICLCLYVCFFSLSFFSCFRPVFI